MNLEDCRPAVQDFALAIEETLRRNDDKPCFLAETDGQVFAKLGLDAPS